MFHSKTIEKVLGQLDSKKEGLTNSEAKSRLEKFGANEIKETGKISALKIFLLQFRSFIVVILVFATIIAALLGKWVDAIVIFIILILNAVLGFVQEYKAEKAIEALKKLAAPRASVLIYREV